MLAADAPGKAIIIIIISSSGLRSLSCSISSSGLYSPPRNSSSRKSISDSHSSRSGSHSSSSSDHQDTLAGGDYSLFVAVAASPTFLRRMSSYTSRAAKHVFFPSTVHYPAG